MKNKTSQEKLHLISAILMATGLVVILLLSFSLDATAGMLVPPQMIAVFPAFESHDADVTTPISITYDQAMDPTTVNPQTFAVHARQTGWLTETLSVDGGMIKLQPSAPLHAGELVQVSATTETLSMDGEGPLEPTVWQFTTAPWSGNGYFHVKESRNDPANRDVGIGDLEGDGDLDMVTSNCGGGIYVLHNDGSANFTEVQHLNMQSCISDVDFGDLDGDGDLDAFLVSIDAVFPDRFLFNNGDGTFTLGSQSLTSTTDTYSELGDLDGDSDLDIFVVSGGFETGTIRVWKNDGMGYFSLGSDFDTAYEHTAVAIGDLNRDGDLDAISTGWNNTFNKVWVNNGTGDFSESQIIPGANTYFPLLGDLNGDGYLDIYLANATVTLIDLPDEVWLNDGTGQFTNSGQILNTPFTLIPALGDMDADGDLDVYVSAWDFVPDEVWLNDGEGNFSLGHRMDEYDDGALAWLGDLDGDGNLDAVTGDAMVNYVIFLNGDWTQAEPIPEEVLGYGFAQCVEQPKIFYIFGGRKADLSYSNKVWQYDTELDTWTELEPMAIPMVGVTAACYQGDIYVAGGADDYLVYPRFAIYHIATNTWSVGPDLPQAVFLAAAGAWDGKFYLVGGTINGDPWPPTGLVQIYDITLQEWTDPGIPIPYPATGPGYVQTGPYLWVVGGGTGSYDYTNLDTTQRYNMADNTWMAQHDFITQRAMFALAATGDYLYAMGGDENLSYVFEPMDMVEMLDLQDWPNASWETFDDPLPQPTAYNSAGFCSEVKTGGEIWSMAGATGAFPNPIVLDDVLYHPAEPCISFGVALPEPMQGEGAAGETITYTLSITNTGVVTDYYTMDVTTTWNIKSSLGGPGPIGPGESLQIVITVDIPPGAVWGNQGLTDIVVASISNPAATDTTTITTTSTTVWTRVLMPLVMKN